MSVVEGSSRAIPLRIAFAIKIGERAKRSGVTIDTVRQCERQGLLPQAQRLASGYRTYHASDLLRLQFVRRAKALGFTLPEIRELLALSQQAQEDMAAMKAAASQTLSAADERIAELLRIP